MAAASGPGPEGALGAVSWPLRPPWSLEGGGEAGEASRMRPRVPFWVTDDVRKRVWKEKILGAKQQ